MKRPLRFELVFVVLVATAALAPGLSRYTLLDPWETHYGEVARMMLQNRDYVHTQWPQDNEGFRSKPVLMFWMMAAGLYAADVARDGGYSGEMVQGERTMVGIRLPFALSAVAGLVLLWWMLARLVSRRVAWLALLVVGTAPMFCMIARIAIPDMPLTACTIGAVSLLALALEDGDRPLARIGRRSIDARHVVLGLAGGFVVGQALYYAYYFIASPQLALRGALTPAAWLPALMLLLLGLTWSRAWAGARFVLRYPVRALPATAAVLLALANAVAWIPPVTNAAAAAAIAALAAVWWRAIRAEGWAGTDRLAERILAMAPIATMRQVYLLAMYALLAVSVLAKGPPGVVVVAAVGALHVLLMRQWGALWRGAFEIKRGLLLAIAIAVPWHIAMYFKEGSRFLDEYIYQHILNRAGDGGVDKSLGTFEYYTSQLGHGMWLWAALLPAALAAALLRARTDTREGRVRFLATLWAFAAVAVFCLVQTKFHHYILPAVPPLALLVAFFLDDLVARRERLHPLFAALGAGIALLVARDLMFEPERWIEMFVFRYDRTWPAAEPYAIDPSDGFLGLGLAAALACAALATRFVRTGVAIACATGLAIALWSLHVYMPRAGTHWGMREAVRAYYEQRTIYGEKRVYFSAADLAAAWRGAGDTWSFETFIPDTLQLGQPMVLTLQLTKPSNERITEREIALGGRVTAIGHHDVTVAFDPGERGKLAAWLAAAASTPPPARAPRWPIRAVDADRLVAWQLYWRGENFWSADEIWGWFPEMKTAFVNTNNQEFGKYIADRSRAPAGRRYFVITGAGQLLGFKSSIPSYGRDTFVIIDTTSNKFSLGAFDL